ncbi:hypothetical protein [Flavobacterium sedimenticola]|uniref:Uncharacterized protein n=1 Tax=Flavobacterium sedimenticola TaxID=3043286 RepID=A0ABT6XT07_9FLAO|nr:hypothetical protein [Flavobacterium sedimenticola]MDI9258237.1 hypothetical protein [Flavobacterium sedimenticola]
MKKILYSILALIPLSSLAQSDSLELNFSVLISEVKGDLNKDQLEDKVIVTQDTIDNYAPFSLQIFFAQTDGTFKLTVSSTNVIEAQYQNGKGEYKEPGGFESVTAKKGVITFRYQTLKGYFEHKFRFQNENFELIGFTQFHETAEEKTTVDFNLTNGRYITKTFHTEKETTTIHKEKKLIRPLPRLQDIESIFDYIY